MLFLQAQIVQNVPVHQVPTENLFTLLMKGGVVIIPILALSVITVYIFITKFLQIRSQAKIDKSVIDQVTYELRNQNLDRAQMIAQSSPGAIGRVISSGLKQVGKPINVVENMMESAVNLEIAIMEKGINYLGIIAGIAPMLGFIGTIAGVINIFYNISLSDNVSIGIIAGGLYQKMISSGSGLIVGVVAYSAYHVLHSEIDRFSLNVQRHSFELMQLLH